MSIANSNNTCAHETCSRQKDKANRSKWCSGHRYRWQAKKGMDAPFQIYRKGMSAYDNVMSQTKRVGDCLEFTGFIANNGYGRVETKTDGVIHAHRAVAEHHLGKSDLIVRHACDNPKCVEIKHLSYGTHKDNAIDRVLHGRSARGTKNGKSFLTEQQVLAIKADSRPSHIVATEYGCASRTVRNIRLGRTWAWLTAA